jgi:serine/threonine-protein kinase
VSAGERGKDPPAEPSGTVFDPAPRGRRPRDGGAEPSGSAPDQPEDRTVFARTPAEPPVVAARPAAGGIQVGDVLNHIFEVKRFLGRGGMGEVFEGCNVNSDERVAIKVMLPALAADPNVISMFRKEARTLTRLRHEALVSYRVLAQEPQLGVLYIVTEYIDGVNLADALATIEVSPAELRALLRRLASGLRAAHDLGAIHRDISPDNVILEHGRLSNAKIIDFGIAKDLDPSSGTVVGTGFAGKLSYVAPEQLGDFGHEIGPWTDVYSLALVMLAVAGRRNVAMGGSLVDAVDKRRAGPDLSAAPDELRDLLVRMLKPNPAERLRSMDEVLALLDEPARAAAPPPPPPSVPRAPVAGRDVAAALARVPKAAWIGVAAAAAALLLLLLLWPSGGEEPSATPDVPAAGPSTAPAPAVPGDPAERARAAISAALPAIACSWVDIASATAAGGRASVTLTGVAQAPTAVQGQVERALAAAGITGDLSLDVAQIGPAYCAALDAFRQVRSDEGGRLTTDARQPEVQYQEDGERAARPVFMLNLGSPPRDFGLFGIDSTGKLESMVVDTNEFRRHVADEIFTSLGGGRYRFMIDADTTGWQGVLLIVGQGPFDPGLIAPPAAARSAAWQARFVATARSRGWRTEMVWVRAVDEQPNVAAPQQTSAPQ